MTRQYFDVQQVREFLFSTGSVATLRDPRITKRGDDFETVDLWQHDGSSRWGRPLNEKAMRIYISSIGAGVRVPQEAIDWAPVSSFSSGQEWWNKATAYYKPTKTPEKNDYWDLDLYYVHLIRKPSASVSVKSSAAPMTGKEGA